MTAAQTWETEAAELKTLRPRHMLDAAREATGKDRVIPALRSDGGKIDKHTPVIYMRETLDHLGLTRPGLRWYQATRHTFASNWVLSGGSIEKLKEIRGTARWS